MLPLGMPNHTHHEPLWLFSPIEPAQTCWDTLYLGDCSSINSLAKDTKQRQLLFEVISTVFFGCKVQPMIVSNRL